MQSPSKQKMILKRTERMLKRWKLWEC